MSTEVDRVLGVYSVFLATDTNECERMMFTVLCPRVRHRRLGVKADHVGTARHLCVATRALLFYVLQSIITVCHITAFFLNVDFSKKCIQALYRHS